MALSTRSTRSVPRLPVGKLLAFALVVAFGVIVAGAALVSFIFPGDLRWVRGDGDTLTISMGSIDDITPGSVSWRRIDATQVANHPDPALRDGFVVYISRLEDGSLVALLGREPFGFSFGCTVPWREGFVFNGVEGWFRDPCRGSTWDRQGLRVFGPAPRHLDAFEVAVSDTGEVLVDISRRIERPLFARP